MDDTYDQLGPIPRICFWAASPVTSYRLREYRASLEAALVNLRKDPKGFKLLMDGIETMETDPDSLSHKLCIIRRADKQNVASGTLISPITPYIQARVVLALRGHDISQQMDWFKMYATVPSCRAMGGVLFEAICQKMFEKEIDISCVLMVRLDGDRKRNQPQWHTSHGILSNAKLEEKRLAVLGNAFHLRLYPSETCHWHIAFRYV
jgi:hypothetical protein